MRTRFLVFLFTAASVTGILSQGRAPEVTGQTEQDVQTATGVVFHDANNNGKHDAGETGLADIRVSNGRDIVRTNGDGVYTIPVDNDDTIFVIKPRNWRTPLSDTQLPRFYYTHKPAGSPKSKFAGVAPTGPLPESINFPLTPQTEPDEFKAIMFGDPQPRDQKEVDYIAHDVVEQLVGTDASFGVTLGDIVFDDLEMFESQARTIALLGIPWYNVIGNHDINFDAPTDQYSDETFERHFGPSYYSFDYGPVHFLVLDDIEWYVEEGQNRGRYRGGLGAEQMEFIRNDLKQIPDEQLVVLMMHIPLVDVRDRQELYRLIEERPYCMSISGHTHHHEHRFITREDGWRGPQPHHHMINVTVSGSWWSGAPDNRGIPHTTMADGGPNGYSIVSFNGQKYSVDYFAAGRPPEYQIRIHCPEEISQSQLPQTTLYANVFNGSPNSKVTMTLEQGTPAVAMQRSVEIDPSLQAVYDAEEAIPDHPWRSLSKPKPSTHLWKATLPKNLPVGTHLIRITAEDPLFGVVHGSRIVRVTASTVAAGGDE